MRWCGLLDYCSSSHAINYLPKLKTEIQKRLEDVLFVNNHLFVRLYGCSDIWIIKNQQNLDEDCNY
jgi:hypothetical protein